MMRALTLICVLACLSIQDAHARLFETEREVLARYGGIAKKLKAGPGEEMFVYQQGDFFVVVAFVNARARWRSMVIEMARHLSARRKCVHF